MKFSKSMIEVMEATLPRDGGGMIINDYTYRIHPSDVKRVAAAKQLEALGFISLRAPNEAEIMPVWVAKGFAVDPRSAKKGGV